MEVPTGCANKGHRICKRAIKLKLLLKTKKGRITGEAKNRRETPKGHRPH
jgi:hypothetical protein